MLVGGGACQGVHWPLLFCLSCAAYNFSFCYIQLISFTFCDYFDMAICCGPLLRVELSPRDCSILKDYSIYSLDTYDKVILKSLMLDTGLQIYVKLPKLQECG